MRTLSDHVLSCEEEDLAFFRTHNVAHLAQQVLEVSRDSQVVDLAWVVLERLAKHDSGLISQTVLNDIVSCVPLESESAQKHFVSILDTVSCIPFESAEKRSGSVVEMLNNKLKCPRSSKVVECLTSLSSSSDINTHRLVVNVFRELSRIPINCLSILKSPSVVITLVSLAESEVADVSKGALESLYYLSRNVRNPEASFSKKSILRLLKLTKSDNEADVKMCVTILNTLSSEGLNRDRFNDKAVVEELVPLLDSRRPLVAKPACSVIKSMSKVPGHSIFQSHEAIMAVLELAYSDSIELAYVSANVLLNISAEFNSDKGMVAYPDVVDVAMKLLESSNSMVAHKGAEILNVLSKNPNNCKAIMQREDLIDAMLERIGLYNVNVVKGAAEFLGNFSLNDGNYLGVLNQEKVVTAMVHRVSYYDLFVVRLAGSVLKDLSCVPSNITDILSREDVVSSALKLIRTANRDCIMLGCKILENLSCSDDNKTGILKREDLLECVVLLAGQYMGEFDEFVVDFLRGLSATSDNCREFVVSTLLKLGKSKNFHVAGKALFVMSSLSRDPESVRRILRDPDVVRELVEFLDHSDQRVFRYANTCLYKLARSTENCRTILRDKAIITRLKSIADNSDNTHMQQGFSRTLLMRIFESQTTFEGLDLDMSQYIVFIFQSLSKWPLDTSDALDAVSRSSDEFPPEIFSCDPVRKAINYFASQELGDQVTATLNSYRHLSGDFEVEDTPYIFTPFP
jgi:hypothetical protein